MPCPKSRPAFCSPPGYPPPLFRQERKAMVVCHFIGDTDVQVATRDLSCLVRSFDALAGVLRTRRSAVQRFLPLLVDLGGWQGKKPDGMSMQMSDTSMTTATRDYERGTA